MTSDVIWEVFVRSKTIFGIFSGQETQAFDRLALPVCALPYMQHESRLILIQPHLCL